MLKNILKGKRSLVRLPTNLLLILITISGLSFGALAANANPLSPIQLTTNLSVDFDGQAPIADIDATLPRANNGEVGTLDYVQQRFTWAVNTLDGNQHNVTNLTFVATINSTGNAQWIMESVGPACATKTRSADGKVLTCIIPGPNNTGDNGDFVAQWSPTTENADNTNASVSFTLNASMVDEGAGPLDPEPSLSNTTNTNIRSEAGAGEIVKRQPGHLQYVYDANGVPTEVIAHWGVGVAINKPNPGIKGTRTNALGDVSFVDNFQGEGAIWNNAELLGCGPNNDNLSTLMPSGFYTGIIGEYNKELTVGDSGTWSCSQAGGQGTNVSVDISNPDWDPGWYPNGSPSNTQIASDAQYGWNDGYPNEEFNSPAGKNNRPMVISGYVSLKIPYADIVAADAYSGHPGIGGDIDNRQNFVKWCNTVDVPTIDGQNPSYVDDLSDNHDCAQLQMGGELTVYKAFTKGSTFREGPESDLFHSGPQNIKHLSDNKIAPGQKFFSTLVLNASPNGNLAIAQPEVCDAIDATKYNFHINDFEPNPLTNNGDWYSMQLNGNTQIGLPVIGYNDVIVSYGSVPAFATVSDQRNVDCTDPSIVWVTDPSTHPDGINNVNLVRITVVAGKPLSPATYLEVSIPIQAKSSLIPGDMISNYAQYRFSTNPWVKATHDGGADCDTTTPAHVGTGFGALSYYLCDRAYVVPANAHVEINDVIDNSGFDKIENISAGSQRTFKIKSGMSYITDVNVSDIKLTQVLPAGMSFVSSTLTPSNIIENCDGDLNPSCIGIPANRTDTGVTTLIFNRGDFSFDVPSAQPDGTVYSDNNLFADYELTVKTAGYLPAGSRLQTKIWLDASSGLSNASRLYRNTYTVDTLDRFNGQMDDDWLFINNVSEFSIEKSVDENEIPLNGTAHFRVSYGNPTNVLHDFDFIDRLPYIGDGRFPNSDFDGTVGLASIDASLASHLDEIYITNIAPASINDDPLSNPAAGTGIWSCTYAQAGIGPCPSLSHVTAIRVTSNVFAQGENDTLKINMSTNNNKPANVYTNRAFGRSSNIVLPIHSQDVNVITPSVSLGNLIFQDRNSNGVFDGSDIGVSNVKLNLYSPGGNNIIGGGDDELIATTTTGSNGEYLFSELAIGKYFVEIDDSNFDTGEVLEGWSVKSNGAGQGSATPNNNADQAADHNALPASNGYNIHTNIIDLENGDEPTSEVGYPDNPVLLDDSRNYTLDLGLQAPLYSVGNYFWFDQDRDGIQDSNERYIDGSLYPITVTLYADNDTSRSNPLGSSTVDSTGHYQINDIIAGDYYLYIDAPADVKFSRSGNANINTSAVDSDFSTTLENRTEVFRLNANSDKADFGIYGENNIGDTVFNDFNQSTTIDGGDTGIPNVTLILRESTGVEIARTVTDQWGLYQFVNILPSVGAYIEIILPPHAVLTGKNNSDPFVATDDSDANPATRLTDPFDISNNVSNYDIDFGMIGDLSIGNFVWWDSNRNGIQDLGENGVDPSILDPQYLMGVLLVQAGGEVLSGNLINFSFLDASGHYSIGGLIEGDYFLQMAFYDTLSGSFVDPATLGFGLSNQGGGSPFASANDSDFKLNSIDRTEDFHLNSSSLDADFGLTNVYKIGDFVFEDLNFNGIQDSGEDGIEGVTATLFNSSGVAIKSDTTDANGKYEILGIEPGAGYYVEFTNIPAHYRFTPVFNVDPFIAGNDSNVDPISNRSQALTINQNIDSLDVGLVRLASISDKLFNDKNQDGIQSVDDPPLANFEVALLDSTGVEITRVTSDVDGLYLFDDLLPGNYFVKVILPDTDWQVSPKDATAENSDSDINPVSAESDLITLNFNDRLTNVDAGLFLTYDLEIIKTIKVGTSSDVKPGENAIYTLTSLNTGTDFAPGPIVVTDVLPGSLNFVSYTADPGIDCVHDNGTVTCTHLGDMLAGQEFSIEIVTTLAKNAFGTVTNNATIAAGQDKLIFADPNNRSNAKVTVLGVSIENPLGTAAGVIKGNLPFTGNSNAIIDYGFLTALSGLVLLKFGRRKRTSEFSN